MYQPYGPSGRRHRLDLRAAGLWLLAAGGGFHFRIFRQRGHCLTTMGVPGQWMSPWWRRLQCGSSHPELVPQMWRQHFPSLCSTFWILRALPPLRPWPSRFQSRKWFWFAVLYQNVFAYGVSLCVYQLGSVILGHRWGWEQPPPLILFSFCICCSAGIRIRI